MISFCLWNSLVSFYTLNSMLFSSPKLKAQVSLSDRFSTTIQISKTTLPILTKIGTKHSYEKGIQLCWHEALGPFPRKDIYEMVKIHEM